MMHSEKTPILLLVHPGSACGSAEFTLGKREATRARRALIKDLDSWSGPLIVIDGSLSVELDFPEYQPLSWAIQGALSRARAEGQVAHREWGCDNISPRIAEAVGAVVARFHLSPETHRMEATGAWAGGTGDSGCVCWVASDFRARGFEVTIRDSAVREPEWAVEGE